MIGGLGWRSTIDYYTIINSKIEQRQGNSHSANIILYSVDFSPILEMQMKGDWDGVLEQMLLASRSIELAGADFLIICSNTMHKVADDIQNVIAIPILNVVDCVASEIKRQRMDRVALLGTRFTMEDSFYRSRLYERHGIEAIVPEKAEMETIQNIIYNELAAGIVNQDSKLELLKIVKGLYAQDIEGIILGCTELPMLIKKRDVELPLFDTMDIYTQKAVDRYMDTRQ